MNNDFEIGQIFEKTYPPMAAIWANANHAQIVRIGQCKYQLIGENDTVEIYKEPVKKPKKVVKKKKIKGE